MSRDYFTFGFQSNSNLMTFSLFVFHFPNPTSWPIFHLKSNSTQICKRISSCKSSWRKRVLGHSPPQLKVEQLLPPQVHQFQQCPRLRNPSCSSRSTSYLLSKNCLRRFSSRSLRLEFQSSCSIACPGLEAKQQQP